MMLEKTFPHAVCEQKIYEEWEKSGAFTCDVNSTKPPFTLMMPPPNVTGSLHMGHALTFTLQDILVRFKRMQGFDVLWQPGTDHAGIATQMVVERLLDKEGKKRLEMSREAFLERVWAWKEQSGNKITSQLRRLGASPDWSRERFTMDDGLSKAVRRVFTELYRNGLIYRARRLVNWDPKLLTAVSDLETEAKEVKGTLYYLNYPVVSDPEKAVFSGQFLTVATTRPETLLGDTAVAVHPEDERYKDLIGKYVLLPLVGRVIPIIGDLHSDPEKGSGAVKITPAHDFNDFAVGERHHLPMPTVLDQTGRITLEEISAEIRAESFGADAAFLALLEGKERFEARALITEKLTEKGFLVKTEPHTHQVPHGDRSGAVIEPRLTLQWFCKTEEQAAAAVKAVTEGRAGFIPKQWENTFFAWMREIQPWCISRQLWWGHRIPAWYAADGSVFVAETAEEALSEAREKFGQVTELVQDPDVLDTWFSSALWPFSTLGWPEKTKESERYYPGDVLVTGFDIIFFWVARMMMSGLYFQGDVPFKDIYIHGLVRDEHGQKMSKSKGNVIDPLELIDLYGTDALRFTICALTGPGRDIKLSPAIVENWRGFITKIWNAARFCELNGVRPTENFQPEKAVLPLSRWILTVLNEAIAEAEGALQACRFNDYAQSCYKFVWNNFCDRFLELAKPFLAEQGSAEAQEIRDVSAYVLQASLKLLHPVIPFVTEELWTEFGFAKQTGQALIRSVWPAPVAVFEASSAVTEVSRIIRLIGAIREVRASLNLAPGISVPLLFKETKDQIFEQVTAWEKTIKRMAKISEIGIFSGKAERGCVQIALDEATAILPLAGVIDADAELARLHKEQEKINKEIKSLETKLGNQDFISRAKPEVIEENRDRLLKARTTLAKIRQAVEIFR